MGDRRGAYKVRVREGDHMKNPGVDGKVILKWILEKWNRRGGHGLDQSGSG
jgi:hypothetical protein